MKIGHWHPGVSATAGLKSDQFNRKRDFGLAEFTKSEYRISNHEYRRSKECILSIFIKRLSAAKPPFEILRFDIRYSAVRCSGQAESHTKFHMNTAAGLKSGQFHLALPVHM